MNGPDGWQVHIEGTKHKKNVKKATGGESVHKKNKGDKGKGVQIPLGTALIIEQTAYWRDANERVLRDLYSRAAHRSTLRSKI